MSERDARLGPLESVALEVKAELGRCSMRLREVLQLGAGAIIALERHAGAPIDLTINGELIGRGEVVAVDDRYGVRITQLVTPPVPRVL